MLHLDMSADFFNGTLKIVQTTSDMSDYPKLYINNALVATSTIAGDVLGDSTYQAGFVFGTGSNGTGFKIKNLENFIQRCRLTEYTKQQLLSGVY